MTNFHENRHRPQRSHDSTYAQSISDRLAKTEAFGHFKIRNRAGVITPDLNHADRVRSAIQGVSHVRCSFDCRLDAQSLANSVSNGFRSPQTLLVDVIKADR